MKKLNLQIKIEDELIKTTQHSMYNAWHNRNTNYGYHSFNLDGINIQGQRNPKQRLNEFRKYYDFKDKNVLDFGCNVGAMLFHLPEIKSGIGVDFDKTAINSARNISRILQRNDISFIKHDFDKDDYDSLRKKIKAKPDVIFMLALLYWVKSWEELYRFCLSFNCPVFIEVNNDDEGRKHLPKLKNAKLVMEKSFDDITGNDGRKTYLI